MDKGSNKSKILAKKDKDKDKDFIINNNNINKVNKIVKKNNLSVNLNAKKKESINKTSSKIKINF
jgi:hypothetical protein